MSDTVSCAAGFAVDPRVVSWERTNISDVSAKSFDPRIDLCVFDLSYLSVDVSLPILVRLFEGRPELVGLIKPLYEHIDRSSMVDETALRGVLARVAQVASSAGLVMTRVTASPIMGSHGSVEFLARFESEGSAASPAPPSECERAILAVSALCRGLRTS